MISSGLLLSDIKKPPASDEDIPDFLYSPGSKSHEAAKLIVFEGITDTEAIAKRVGFTKKTATVVKRAVLRVADQIPEAKEPKRGAGGSRAEDVGAEAEDPKPRQPSQSKIDALQKGNQVPVPGSGSESSVPQP